MTRLLFDDRSAVSVGYSTFTREFRHCHDDITIISTYSSSRGPIEESLYYDRLPRCVTIAKICGLNETLIG